MKHTVPTLDEWADTFAARLRQQVRCHLEVFLEDFVDGDEEELTEFYDGLERLIMISVRDWAKDYRIE